MNMDDKPTRSFMQSFYWTSISAGRRPHYSLITREDALGYKYLCGKARVLPCNEAYQTWLLETDSDTYIVNNMVVANL